MIPTRHQFPEHHPEFIASKAPTNARDVAEWNWTDDERDAKHNAVAMPMVRCQDAKTSIGGLDK